MNNHFFIAEIQRYIGPLILYGEGVVLELSYQSFSFFGRYQCDTHNTPSLKLQETYKEGHTLYVEATLHTDTFTSVPINTPTSIQYQRTKDLHAPLDVKLIGTIAHIDFIEKNAILKCGIPVCISWENAWGDKRGEKILVQGDLTLYKAEESLQKTSVHSSVEKYT